MKKVFSMILVAAMLLSCITAVPAYAAEGVTYTLDAQVNGDKVDVVVRLTGNDEGLSATAFELSYNKEAVAPDMDTYEEVGVEADDEFVWYRKTTNTDVDVLDNGNVFVLHYNKSGQDVVRDGVVFKISFDILDSTKTFDFAYEAFDGQAENNSNTKGAVPYTSKVSGYSDSKGEDGIVAEGSVIYTLSAELHRERLDVTITLSENVSGLSSTAFMLTYNKNALAVDMDSYEELGSKRDDEFVWYSKSTSTDISELDDGIFVLHYDKNAENVVKDGVVLKISFDVIDKSELFDFNYAVVDGLAKNNSCVDENGDSVAVPYAFVIAEGTPDIYTHTHTPSAAAPTCTENVYCTECEEVLEEALGHNVVTDDAVDATCTETGLTEGSHCSLCGEVFIEQKVVDALGHTVVVDGALEPTCTETGLTEGSHCDVCGEVLVAQEIIDKLGHTVVVDKAVDATCTTDGLTEGSHCSVCGEVLVAQKVILAFGHTEVVDAAVAPSCYESGLTEGIHCSVCGEVLVAQKVIAATGAHVWAEEFTVDKEAAVGVEGEKSKHCTTEGCTARGEITAIPALVVVTVNGEETVVASGDKFEMEAEYFEDGRVFDYWEVISGDVVLVLDKEELENFIMIGDENVVINSVTYLVGDTDRDDSVTASDITRVIRAMKNSDATKYQDVDNDSNCTASDITAVIQIMKDRYSYPGYIKDAQ